MAQTHSGRQDLDSRVMDIVNTAIAEAGGAGRLLREGERELLPALMESAYALVLHDEQHQSYDEIAQRLHTTRGAVESVFAAPREEFMQRIRYRARELPEFQPHRDPDWSGMPTELRLDPESDAGALARFAYEIVLRKEGTAR